MINKSEGKLYVLKRHGDAIAFYGITENEESTDIVLLRICDKDICNALFFQIVSEILKRNLKSNKSQIVFKEKYITEVSEKFDSLIKGLFELKEYIDNTQDYVSSERGELEIERIKDTLETLLNG